MQRFFSSPCAILAAILLSAAISVASTVAVFSLDCNANCACGGKGNEGCTCITVAPVRCPCSNCPCEAVQE